MKLTVTDECRFNTLQAAFQDRETFTLTGAGLTTEYLATEFSYSPNQPGIGSPCVELELVQVSKASGPTQWSGDGLPPVGAVCELRSRGGGWGEAEIKYHGRGLCVWLWVRHDGNTDQIEYAESPDRLEFRPIRTAEQIAAEERKAREAELATVIKVSGWESPETLAAYLESHGYRKVEQ